MQINLEKHDWLFFNPRRTAYIGLNLPEIWIERAESNVMIVIDPPFFFLGYVIKIGIYSGDGEYRCFDDDLKQRIERVFQQSTKLTLSATMLNFQLKLKISTSDMGRQVEVQIMIILSLEQIKCYKKFLSFGFYLNPIG